MSEQQLRLVALLAGVIASVIVAVVFWQITFNSDPPQSQEVTGVREAPALPTRPITPPTPPVAVVTDGVNAGDTSGDEVVRQQVTTAADVVMAYRNVATSKDSRRAARFIAKYATEEFTQQAQEEWARASWSQQEPGTITTSELITAQVFGDVVRVQIKVTTASPDGLLIVGDETWDVDVTGDGLVAQVTLA